MARSAVGGEHLPYSGPAIGFHPMGFRAGASLRHVARRMQRRAAEGMLLRLYAQFGVGCWMESCAGLHQCLVSGGWPYGPNGGWLGGMGGGLGGHGEAKPREFVWGKSVWDVGQKGDNSVIDYHLRKIYSYNT